MGCEISYPLKPFMIMANEDNFWDSSLSIINNTSAKMLQLNADPYFFTEVFQELKNEGKWLLKAKTKGGCLVGVDGWTYNANV
uniref:Uncharacterized protein n=1 Tax=Hucho hucho TaxID=62062 RepID=A0A4W5Q306_9TELE